MPLDWSDIEDALHLWVETAVASLGVPARNIHWGDQEAPDPDHRPSVVVRRGDLTPVGPAYVEEEFDESRPAGQEIEQKVTASKSLTVQLQGFDARTGGDATGSSLLSRIQDALDLPNIRDALLAAGMVPYGDPETVRNVTDVERADFESRAVLDVQFLLTDTVSGFVGYIQQYEFTQTVDGQAQPAVTIDLPEGE